MKACDKVNSTALQIHHFGSLVLVPISDGLACPLGDTYKLRHNTESTIFLTLSVKL